MNKHIFLWSSVVFALLGIALFNFEESRTLMVAFFVRVLFFVKKNIITMVSAFFLVKGKFILTIFLKKIALLSTTGLGKRYLIEKVINKNLKIHFIDHISDDIKRLISYIKEHFKDFPIVKRLITGIAFLGSLGFVGKFMGGMLAMKVFIAKFWSFILALVIKFGTAILYFFTEYLWDSWFAPLLEILLFSWLLELLEKIPFFKKYLLKIYDYFIGLFDWAEEVLERIFHIPAKKFFKYLAKKIKQIIYQFIGHDKVSAWKRLLEERTLNPNAYSKLHLKRQDEKRKKGKEYLSIRNRVLQNRKKFKKTKSYS